MTALALQWRATPAQFDLQWRGNGNVVQRIEQEGIERLADFIVPAPTVEVDLTDGAGIEIVGIDIRVNIDELPSG